MKFLIIALITPFFFTNCSFSQHIVGTNNNGEFSITMNLDSVKTAWEKSVSTTTVPVEMINFHIFAGVDTQNNNAIYYFLSASSQDSKITISAELQLSDNGKKFLFVNSGRTVTCTGCRYACNPEMVNGEPACSAGCTVSCTKTVTVNM